MASGGTGAKFFGQFTHRRLLHFVGHLLSFVPALLIAAMAALLIAVPRNRIIEFLFFTISTISLEVCINCLRAKHHREWHLQKQIVNERDADQRAFLAGLLRYASTDCAQCRVYVGAVAVSWVIVAFIEVAHMGNLVMIPGIQYVAGLLSGFNFSIAALKTWVHAGAIALEADPPELQTETAPKSPVPVNPR